MKSILVILLTLSVSETLSFAEDSKLGRNSQIILQQMDKQIDSIKIKAISLLEKEMKAETQKGDLEGALATKEIIEKLKLDTNSVLPNSHYHTITATFH